MQEYSYSSLSPGDDSIRLLCLLPDENESAPIRCQLVNHSLQRTDRGAHQYEALSYVWGAPGSLPPIYIGNTCLNVTENLHAALTRLRDRSFERIFWVDAVCINQKDNQEKGGQIQLMAQIYSQASRVVIWLGGAENDSDQALEDIRVAAEDESGTSDGLSSREPNKEAILKLLERPWFQRIWVREKRRPSYMKAEYH